MSDPLEETISLSDMTETTETEGQRATQQPCVDFVFDCSKSLLYPQPHGSLLTIGACSILDPRPPCPPLTTRHLYT